MPLISIPADAFRGHGSSLLPRFAQSGCFRSCCSRRSRRLHSNQLGQLSSLEGFSSRIISQISCIIKGLIKGGATMISKQETFNLSPYMALYDLIIPKDNMLRQINELVDFSFILDELKSKYCLVNVRNAILCECQAPCIFRQSIFI